MSLTRLGARRFEKKLAGEPRRHVLGWPMAGLVGTVCAVLALVGRAHDLAARNEVEWPAGEKKST